MVEDMTEEVACQETRHFELDLAKALAVVFMIFVHTRMLWGEHVTPSWFGIAVDFAGTPLCAPVFMICMGAGWYFTRHDTAFEFMRRGLLLFGLGYLLNVLRLSIPLMLIGGFPGEFSVLTPLNAFLAVDILQFAGMAFLFMALMRRLKLSDPAVMVVTLLMSALGGVLNGRLLTGIDPLAALQGLLVFSGLTTAFPLLSWLPYPVAGYVFARWLSGCGNSKGGFYGGLLLWSLALVLTVYLTGSRYGLTLDSYIGYSGYYAQTPFTTVGILSLAFGWMSILYGLSRLCRRDIPSRLIQRWSRNVLIIYLLQWIILDWSAIILHRFRIEVPASDTATILISLAVLALSDGLSCLWKRKTIKNLPVSSS